MVGGGGGGLGALRGTVISIEPPENPTIVTVAMSDGGKAEVTLNLVDDREPPMFLQEQVTRVLPIQAADTIAAHDIKVEDMIREWRARPLVTAWRLGPAEPRPVARTAAVALPATPGADIEFEGVASAFSPEPFMLTFQVLRSRVTIIRAKR